ncbi:MAG: hypothetical protein KDA63_03960, partial [Planctomycetales bacterium]|nr:hypothetical protein [Planctomycetales bacterium]
ALSTRTTTTAVPDFNGVSVSGDCVAIPGGRGAPYVDTFASQTSLAITGATHGKGCDVAVFVYSADDPRDRLYAGYTVDDGTCDVAVDLGSVAQSGKVVIL